MCLPHHRPIAKSFRISAIKSAPGRIRTCDQRFKNPIPPNGWNSGIRTYNFSCLLNPEPRGIEMQVEAASS